MASKTEKAIQLLPACVNRRPAERELVRDVVRSAETIVGALEILEDTFDPPIDTKSCRNSVDQIGNLGHK